jgi:outer membrane protein TolC
MTVGHKPMFSKRETTVHMKKISWCLLVAILLFSQPARAEEFIKTGETLTLERCIEIALKNQPNMVAAMGAIKVSESRIGQAKANYYPQIDWSSRYDRISSYTSNTLRRDNRYDDYLSRLTLSQNLYDFEKTATQVKIQRLNLDSSRSDLDDVSSQTVFGVKQAFFTALQALRNRDVATETVQQFQHHLDQAKGFFEVGVKPKFDVTKAEVDLSNAKLNLIKAENTFRVSRANLNNAMGLPGAPDYALQDDFGFQKYDAGFDDVLKRAYADRPDLQSLRVKREAAENTIELQKKGYYPTLSGSAGYGFGGQDFPLQEGWNVGAALTFPLFSGLSTKYHIEEARATLDILKANEESLRQAIYLDVKQAYLNLQQAGESIVTTELTVRQAHENLDLANGRYAAGGGNPIEVTDALVSLANAKTAYIAAIYDYKVARASLEKAMGMK